MGMQEEGGDGAGQRSHEADAREHQENGQELSGSGDRVGVPVAHGSGGDKGPPDAVGKAHAFRQMDAHGPQQDDDQGGNADVLESVRVEETPDARGEPHGVGEQVQVPGEPQNLAEGGEPEQTEQHVKGNDGQQVPDMVLDEEPFGPADGEADHVIQHENPVNDPVCRHFPFRRLGSQVNGRQRHGDQGQQAHARLIGQLQEQEVPGHVVERVHDGE